MVFSSLLFLVRFLPIVLILYYISPRKYRNFVLFVSSLFFYAWGEPVYVILMLFSSVFNYYMGTELERLYYDDKKQKLNLVFAIIINLGILVFFKYYGFLLDTFGRNYRHSYFPSGTFSANRAFLLYLQEPVLSL